ncbi:PspA/IM30 family protein [Nocardia nova]|uniref:PspA/IM30 family protein n=1 Tax=Nocardia nova TaxID=37330 RepID=UPI00340A154E
MSETGDMAALLAALRDEDLLEVVVTATTGRPGLEKLHLTALALAAPPASVEPEPDVTSATPGSAAAVPPPVSGGFGQVAVGSGVPLPPEGFGVPGGYSESGVPTFESVRDKVEQRYGTAQGMGELDRQTPAGRGADEQWQAREKAARERLDEIRKSMRGDDAGH